MKPVTVRWGAFVALVAYTVVVINVGVYSPFGPTSLATAVLAALIGIVTFGIVYGAYLLARMLFVDNGDPRKDGFGRSGNG